MFWDDRVRKAPSKAEKEALYAKQKERCLYCGKPDDIRYFHVDHKTPFANGGREILSNKQLLCGPCNTLKGNRTDGEFRRLYKLTPARQASSPPTQVIPRSYFDAITKELKAKATGKKKREAASWWW